MIDPQSMHELRNQLQSSIAGDRRVLDELCEEVQGLRSQTRRIQPRSTTAISLVGTDGGNNRIEFDPFMVQLVRVVDSSNNEYCLESVTPTSDRMAINRRHIAADGTALTALGRLLVQLGLDTLWELTPMIPAPPASGEPIKPISPSWVQVYRELMEWAILLDLVATRQFGTDTVIVADGNLRSKVFKQDLFIRYREALKEAIDRQWREHRRRIYLAGVAKHSKVLQRYRLAMAIEGILRTNYPAYVEVPRELEERAYVWNEYARGDEEAAAGGEQNKFVGGKMFFVKFGARPHDPIWPVDIFLPQASDAAAVLGYMLADAIDGFPVPFYPQCLQRAHENAALVDFDLTILQDEVVRSIRGILGTHGDKLDEMTIQTSDPAGARYS